RARVPYRERNRGQGRIVRLDRADRGRRHAVRELGLFEHARQCVASFFNQMRLFLIASLATLFAAIAPAAKMDVHLIDVEGGKSLLVVSPTGESLLIDVGWPTSPQRDASTDRIVEAIKSVGL